MLHPQKLLGFERQEALTARCRDFAAIEEAGAEWARSRESSGERDDDQAETAFLQTSRRDALMSMMGHHFRHVPVVDSSGRLRGFLSIGNLLHGQMEELKRQQVA